MEFHVTPEMAAERIDEVQNVGEQLGLDPTFVDTGEYDPGDRDDFERYLDAYDIRFFSVDEAVRPNHPAKAAEAGFTQFVPPLHLWPWSLIVLRLGDMMRTDVGRPIRLRNLYRPMSYNRLVASSGIDSDHPNACSGDFDFSTEEDRRTAEQLMRDTSREIPALEMSMGLGALTLHIGAMSPKGKRHWFYDSYKDPRVPLE